MLRFLADENFDHSIVRGVLRRLPNLDLVTAQDVGLAGTADPDVLAWAAEVDRLVLTHDVSTMTAHAGARVAAGLAMPGLIEVHEQFPVRQAIDDIVLLAEASEPLEWQGQILFLPLR